MIGELAVAELHALEQRRARALDRAAFDLRADLIGVDRLADIKRRRDA